VADRSQWESPPHSLTRIVVRPLGSGLPLGFFAFGQGMFILGGVGTRIIPAHDVKTAGLLLAAYVFPLEAAAMVIAFLARDTVGGTALGLFTTSWLALGLALFMAKPGATSTSLGLYSCFFAAVVLVLGIAAVQGKPLIAAIMTVAAGRSIAGGIYEFTGNKTADTIGGVLAFAIAAAALYGGLAFLLEDAAQKEVLPVFRRGAAKDSLEGSLADQLGRVESEAGVRQQL
jgi:succinate-acetate transporter protein